MNEPGTAFALPQNVGWAKSIIERWQPLVGDAAREIPLVIAGEEIFADRELRDCLDPSRPGVVVGRYRQASEQDLARAIDCGRRDGAGWRERSVEQRSEILARVAQELRRARGDLMGAALAGGGKTLRESGPGGSEAVGFVEVYRGGL